MQDATKALESLSLDVESLYRKMVVSEAKEIALKELYSSNLAPEIPKSAMKSLLQLAVPNVHFKCCTGSGIYNQSLATGASLAVILANAWMKSFEESLQKPELSENISAADQNGNCNYKNRRVTSRGTRVEVDSCKKLFHAKCQMIKKEECAIMQDVVWICTYCSNQQTEERIEEMKLCKRYVDDIICTVRGDPDEYLKTATSLQKNL